jgi:hypothetical protein
MFELRYIDKSKTHNPQLIPIAIETHNRELTTHTPQLLPFILSSLNHFANFAIKISEAPLCSLPVGRQVCGETTFQEELNSPRSR